VLDSVRYIYWFCYIGNCRTIADQSFKSIMNYSGLNIEECKIVVSFLIVVKLYAGIFHVVFYIIFLCSTLRVMKEYSWTVSSKLVFNSNSVIYRKIPTNKTVCEYRRCLFGLLYAHTRSIYCELGCISLPISSLDVLWSKLLLQDFKIRTWVLFFFWETFDSLCTRFFFTSWSKLKPH
jgi:hypothetical protein